VLSVEPFFYIFVYDSVTNTSYYHVGNVDVDGVEWICFFL